jgi:hypothetical protein
MCEQGRKIVSAFLEFFLHRTDKRSEFEFAVKQHSEKWKRDNLLHKLRAGEFWL